MSVVKLANETAALCREARFAEVQNRLWSDDIVAVEAMEGPMARLEGRAAVQQKLDWWTANHTVHGCAVEGPFVNGDRFALKMTIDVTPAGQSRTQMSEVVLYDVRDGKIVQETYFWAV